MCRQFVAPPRMAVTPMEELLLQVQELCLREPDETKPYDFKYQAAELCKQAVETASGKTLEQVLEAPPEDAGAELFILLARRGLSLMETDLLKDAQDCIEAAVNRLLRDERKHLALLLECHNSLGALQSGRDDLQGAEALLEAAYTMYKRHRGPDAAEQVGSADVTASEASTEPAAAATTAEGKGADSSDTEPAVISGGGGTTDASPQPASQPTSSPSVVWDDVEKQHTSTLFFLAQVHGHAKRKALSAEFCAATLQRQLESGQFFLQEWMQNCLQLSGFYVACNAFAIAEYCLLAASQVAEKAASGAIVPLPVKIKGGAATQDDPAAAAAAVKKGAELDPDVAANLELAWAKWYLGRLVTSHEQHIDGMPAEMPYPSVDHFPKLLTLKCLDLPSPGSLAWGASALVTSFEQARDVFNAGMLRYNKALEHYVLDGCVTEHCNILMEISNMYRCLASFEPDVHRKRLMHRHRVLKLQPVHGVLNPEFFLGLVRSISLELGNVSREVMELEEKEGRPATKVAATRLEAIRFYQDFLDTFRNPIGPDGVLPDRIVDEANERYFLLASFSLGRVMSGRVADKDVERTLKACDLLTWTADYVKRHNVVHFQREAQMSLEMVDLIKEKLELTRRMQGVGK